MGGRRTMRMEEEMNKTETLNDLLLRVEVLEKVLYTLVDFRSMSIYRKDILKFRETMKKKDAIR